MQTREQETNLRRFSAGALAGKLGHLSYRHVHVYSPVGMTSVVFTYPLELVRVRMAFHSRVSDQSTGNSRPSFLRAMCVIYREGAVPSSAAPTTTTQMLFERFPILKFYRGFTVTMVGMIPYAGTAFLTWDFLRAYFFPVIDDHSKRPPPMANLAIGAVSGAISQTASYPFEVVRRRMQVGGLTRPDRWLRWGETMRAVYANGGWRGFYVGLGIGYLKIIPMTAISFTVWQGGKSLLGV